MATMTKRQKALQGKIDRSKNYPATDALKLAKDFATADNIRDELKSQFGVIISVTKDGITWRKE